MKTKYPLDQFTFGSSKAAETLADILSEAKDDRLTARVSRFIGDNAATLRHVSTIRCASTRLRLINMIGNEVKSTKLKFPPRVESYAKNVVQAHVKTYRELDEIIVNDDIARIQRERAARELARRNQEIDL